jgi:hypothetical protein
MKSRLLGGMCVWSVTAISSLAQAAPLNLTLNDVPDIVAQFIDVTYDAASDAFVASGFALEIDDDGSVPPEEILIGTFDLSATIDATGTLIGGSLTIGGTVPTLGYNSGTLLTGTLTSFGFPNVGSDPFEFLFDATGGDAAPLYGSGPAGVILSGTGFDGDFSSDFDNLSIGPGSGIAVANVGVVPLPAALWLFGSGLLGLTVLGRRRGI